MKKVLHSILFLLFVLNASAQDPQFTQYYATQIYLNPAFTGATNMHRVSLNQRIQWPGIKKAYSTSLFSYDANIEQFSSGFGLHAINDKSGSGALRNQSAGMYYAYQIEVNKKIEARAGISFSYTQLSIDWNNLVFNDQLYRAGNGSVSTFETPVTDKVRYLDFNTGFLLYSEKFWAGFAAHHLNQPNASLIEGENIIPRKYSFHGGYKNPVKVDGTELIGKSITASFNYKAQADFDQLDLGFYFTNEPLLLGVWYRGIPLFKSYQKGYPNNDAIAFVIGYEAEKPRIRIGYSYDITISRLVTNSAGAHELSILYEWGNRKKKKFTVSCPKF